MSAPPSSKRTKQCATSLDANSADSPFKPHVTWAGHHAAPTSCPCGLRSDKRTLVVGDGDLSYSVGLMLHWRTSRIHREEWERSYMHDAYFDNCHRAEPDSAAASSSASPPADFSYTPQLTSTTYEDIVALSQRYTDAQANATQLRSWGVKVLHGVDARKLETYVNLMPHETERRIGIKIKQETHSRTKESGDDQTESDASSSSSSSPSSSPLSSSSSALATFHTIVFHFPHVGGKSRIHLNRALLTEFLQSAEKLLVRPGDRTIDPTDEHDGHHSSSTSVASSTCVESSSGCIHVSLIRGQGGTPCDTRHRPNYGDHWQLLECASKAGLVLTHVFPFADELYIGYNNRGFRSRDEEFFWRGVAITHVITREATMTTSDFKQQIDGQEDVTSIDQSVQAQVVRHLCRVAHHPLQLVSARIADFLISLNAGNEHRPIADELTPLGYSRLPFVCVDDAPVIITRAMAEAAAKRQLVTSEVTATAATQPSHIDQHHLFTHVTFSPCALIHVIDGERAFRPDLLVHLPSLVASSSSTFLSGPVVERCAQFDTAQWNLKPMLAAAADMEAQLPQPIACNITQQNNNANEIAVTPVSHSSASCAVVPMMRGGMPVLHHQISVQRFSVAPSSASTCTAEECAAAIARDFDANTTRCVQHLFAPIHPAATVEVRIAAHTHPFSMLVDDHSTVQIDRSIEVLFGGVWHCIGRGGLLATRHVDSSPASVVCAGWVVEWSLDKIAMLIFGINDPRCLWSRDTRFLKQFEQMETNRQWRTFRPSSIHPIAYVRDTSLFIHATPPVDAVVSVPSLPSCSSVSQTLATFRLFVDVILVLLGFELVCSVSLTDTFIHPQRGPAMRIRIIYQSIEHAISPQIVLEAQRRVHQTIAKRAKVEIR